MVKFDTRASFLTIESPAMTNALFPFEQEIYKCKMNQSLANITWKHHLCLPLGKRDTSTYLLLRKANYQGFPFPHT